jgi:hypothetical protein
MEDQVRFWTKMRDHHAAKAERDLTTADLHASEAVYCDAMLRSYTHPGEFLRALVAKQRGEG